MSMMFFTLVFTLIYLELVYHISIVGLSGMNPFLGIAVILVLAGVEGLLITLGKRLVNKIVLWIMQVVNFLLFASQLIYMKIFTQPLLMAAVVNAGNAALTNYWRELLYAIGQNAVSLLFLALPLVLTGILLHKKVIVLEEHKKGRIWSGSSIVAGIVTMCAILLVGYQGAYSFYEDYQSYYDPKYVIEQFGVLASVQRDFMGDVLPEAELDLEVMAVIQSTEETEIAEDAETQIPDKETVRPEVDIIVDAESETTTEEVDTSPNVLDINFTKLYELASDKSVNKLVTYMEARTPTNKNEYTGMFEGYNLIYLTAEGFSPYAVSEELTPTLYKLSTTGFVAENYYVPLWQTSTSDGEYVNLTGQIPYKQFSMAKSAENEQPYSLPAYFAAEGVKSYAYHNNSLSYYDRHLSHPNLGYDFKAIRLGELSSSEWGSQIWKMKACGRLQTWTW